MTNMQSIINYGNTPITHTDALLVIDMQYDFIPGGLLPVVEGDTIVNPISHLMEQFFAKGATVVCTQDWHPKGHLSFASSHGKQPFEPISQPGIGPVLWPDHCVAGTHGAALHNDLATQFCHAIIRKGYNKAIDSYSAFLENDKKTVTGLAGYLQSRGVVRIFVCGLAFDYCVHFSAVDGAAAGFEAIVVTDCTKAVNSPETSVDDAIANMNAHGVKFCTLNNLLF
ncbi:MAG: bifunctional nicotinamidase/pyrazinamidase [Spirochaetes bacterium]|nr:bifunctional nicotinamidase/pyrazinamidase [Spirochaetota bacterium]